MNNSGSVGFRLGNAEERHRAAPRSFFIPSREERDSLEAGSLVQLLFEIDDPSEGMPSAERMWVQVLSRGGGNYVGALDNQPNVITAVGPGNRIVFGPEHVISVWVTNPILGLKAMVSRRSHDQDLRPRFVCREAPLNPQDSGWQVLVGDETSEELDDASQVLLQPLGFLIDRWPELESVFTTSDSASEWLWNEADAAYRPFSRD